MTEARWLLVLCLVAVGLAAPAAADIELEERFPLQGEAVAVTVRVGGAPLPGVELEAQYRPNSATGSSETLPPTDAAGVVRWTPREAGLVTLAPTSPAVGVEAKTVAVRYGGFPSSGLVIMVLAGLLLFAGAGAGLALLLSGEEPDAAEVEPPST